MSLVRFPIQQYGYVVNDIDEAARHWYEMFGAGPFFISRHHKSEDEFHRGVPNEADLSYAFGQAGPAHIQLIQQHNDAPSVYRDMFPSGEQGLHHVAILVPDIEAEKARFEAAGCEKVTELVSAAQVAYMDARDKIGCFVELYEKNDAIAGTFDNWKQIHDEWDGVTDPFREL
jgi:catechol 2,3-dioxygenase-like lactoylglutathione lyase family enzyme